MNRFYEKGRQDARNGAGSLAHHYKEPARSQYEEGFLAGKRERDYAIAEQVYTPKHSRCNALLRNVGGQWFCPHCCSAVGALERF